MKIAKPLLLVVTPLGMVVGLCEAYRLVGGLVFLMAIMMGGLAAAFSVGGAAVADGAGSRALSVEDPVSRRDDGHRAGAVGLHRAPRGAGAATARAFDERYHGVFAANAALRAAIAPAGRGSKARSEPERPMPKHVALRHRF